MKKTETKGRTRPTTTTTTLCRVVYSPTTRLTDEVDFTARTTYRYAALSPSELPDTESLATTLKRVLPYWEKVICPDIKAGKRVLVRPM